MITYWQQENGRFVKTEWDERDKSQNTWVDARSVTREDIRILQEDFGVEQDTILDILDPDELSRIDKEDNYTITIARIPVFDPTGDISYFTAPIGVIVYPDIVITMGCNVHCPNIQCKERYDWGLDDPTGKSDEEFIKTANKIIEKILELRR